MVAAFTREGGACNTLIFGSLFRLRLNSLRPDEGIDTVG
jgi:hypothetical protein